MTLKNGFKNSSFEASKTVFFETVFESKKSLFSVGFYNVLSDFDFCSSLKSRSKVTKKELQSFFFDLCSCSTKVFFEFQKQLLGSCCWIQKSLIYVYICVYICVRKSTFLRLTDSLKNTCFWSSKRDVFKSQKSFKKNQFLAPC